MKLSRYFSKLLWVLPALMMAGCSDDTEQADQPLSPSDGAGVEELTLNLSLPGYDVTEIGSRASANPTERINKVSVFCYGADGAWLQTTSAEGPWTFRAGRATIKVPINKRTAKVEVVTNFTAASSATNPAATFSGLSALNPSLPVMWGQAQISAIANSNQGSAEIKLLRNYAKVTVRKAANATGSFTIGSFGVSNTASTGSLAPSSKTLNPVAVTLNPSETFDYNTAAQAITVPADEAVYVYETPADTEKADGSLASGGRIVIQIDGTYYCVAFRQRVKVNGSAEGSEIPGAYNYSKLPILRNHHYTVNVIEVREKGWSTYAEAAKAAPDNRLTVEITDKTPEVVDVTATRDYMLGVSDAVAAPADASTQTVTVVSSYPGTPQVTLTSDQSWVTIPALPAGTTVGGITEGANPTGKQYAIGLQLAANELSEARTATVTVTSGLLTRTITVTQDGRDYRRDSNRKVIMTITGYGAGATTVKEDDYFDWLDNKLQGVLPTQNRGVELNQGLHFPAVPAYQVEYSIPKLATSETATVSNGYTVTQTTISGKSYWKVTVSNPNLTGPQTDGMLTITNAQDIRIFYPLYRRGVVHEINSGMAEAFQPKFRAEEASNLKTGWFYYGVANVSGRYFLDRNLGATSNDYYSATSSAFVGNTDARGGYFKVATSKSPSQEGVATTVNGVNALNFHNFRLPTEAELEIVGIQVGRPFIGGEEVLQYYLSTSSTFFPDGKIYIPAGGYYEGYTHRYETHANIWTLTLLSGNQGFSPQSPDFGFWFIYFNGYNGQATYSNMRFCNGALGMAPNANTIYKYMPMRLIYDSNAQ